MAHNLMTRTINGQTEYSMIYREGMPTPWHKQQTNVKTFTHNDIYEAMATVGADYQTHVTPSTFDGMNPNGYQQVWGNGMLLGQVGRDYVPLQNSFFFQQWHNVAVSNGLKLATIGVIGHGEDAFASYLLNTDTRGRQLFINVANNHTGSMSATLSVNHVMIVCQNTLKASHKEGIIKTRHTKNAEIRITGLTQFVDQQIKQFEDDGITLDRMRDIVINYDDYISLIDKLTDAAGKEAEQLKRDKMRQALIDQYYRATGVDMDTQNTLYGAYMAATEALTHHRPTKSRQLDGVQVQMDRVFTPSNYAVKLNQLNKLVSSMV